MYRLLNPQIDKSPLIPLCKGGLRGFAAATQYSVTAGALVYITGDPNPLYWDLNGVLRDVLYNIFKIFPANKPVSR
jgi:hypothetical protein